MSIALPSRTPAEPARASGPTAPSAQRAAERPANITDMLSNLDHRPRGTFGLATGGQSPWAALQAWEDWIFHLSLSRGRQMELWRRSTDAWMALWSAMPDGADVSDLATQLDPFDRRFRYPGWNRAPFNYAAQAHLLGEDIWRAATRGIPGMSEHYARRVGFMGRFVLNAMAPINFPWSNPEVIDAARDTGGMNFINGAALFAEDIARVFHRQRLKGLDDFKVGETLATTKGEVIFRNELMELIQYAPTTDKVRAEPILIVPAWIMKYYILDLSPPNSLVSYLVAQGYTVFIVSWKNPGRESRNATFEDYRSKGVMAAIDAIGKVAPQKSIHGVGYCLGGTVLSIAAAAMCRDGDSRLATLTLLAAQTDFEEAGELMLFIDESQLALLEDMMQIRGYLDTRQMTSAFHVLRANEMLFSQFVERYFLGKPRKPTDIDAWLADATRMPATMHSEYLRQLFLENRFAHGTYRVDGRAVALKDIRLPIFALGAERDHIAPWRSVYKIELYGSAPVTFVLVGGGHNTSVVSPPGKPGAYYRCSSTDRTDDYVDPDKWLETAPKRQGSWWPEWVGWLASRSSSQMVAPPPLGCPSAGLRPLEPAPGSYVLET